ncbi:MAG: sulfatase [Gemmatimonadota bacterium]|nr:sulfatase [Gemmatimonadota bacterium]
MAGTTSEPTTWRPSSLLLLAVAAGVLTGFAEAAFLEFQRLVFGRIVFMGRHAWWMKPMAEAILFSTAVMALVLAGRVVPALRSVRAVATLCASLAILSLLLMVGRLHIAAQLVLAIGLGVQMGRIAERLPARGERFVRIAALALVGLVPLLGFGERILRAAPGDGAGTEAGVEAPNVLLLVLDTVRARSLSAFGHHRPTSPALERVAAEGILFERAISPAPWTLPSHASMFTGLLPHDLSANWRIPLDDREVTIAEHLASAGYSTAGFVANMGYVGWETGLDRGFAHYEDHPISLRQLAGESTLAARAIRRLYPALSGTDENFVRKHAADVNRGFLSWLEAQEGPFFAFLNYYDAHGPYQPVEPYRSAMADGEPRGGRSPLHRWLDDPFSTPPEPGDIQRELWAYEAAIAGLDAEIGSLLDALADRGILDRTVVIIASDHGEEFGEHGVFDHGNSLYLDGVHVPLIVRFPERLPAGARVTRPVSLRDLPATITDLTGTGVGVFPGRSLADAAGTATTGGASVPATSQVSFAPRLPDWFPVSRGDMASLTDRRWHLIRNGDRSLELYDLEADPEARSDLAGDPSTGALRDSLAALLAATVGGP